MHSLEALKSYVQSNEPVYPSDKAYNIIKKDLKILEIIKKRKPNIFLFTQTKNYYQYMDCEYGGYWTAGNENIMQEEEYNLIAKWLRGIEND